MAELDLNTQRQKLEALRLDYQQQIQNLTTGDEAVTASDPQHEGSLSDDPADDADQLYEAEKNQSLAALARNQLELVEAALARLDNGTYGFCIDCGKPIPPRRLEAQPFAQYCIEDQQKHDELGA